MIERYYPASALTDYGTIDWQVIDGRTETIALQRCASEAEALPGLHRVRPRVGHDPAAAPDLITRRGGSRSRREVDLC